MWSAALGLAGSAIGAISASKTANAQLAQQQYQFQRQMELQETQMGMARDAQRQQQEENAYQRQIEQMNRLIAQQEREYQRDQSEEYKEQLMAERRQMIERQIQEDREAARQRQFQLEQLLQNQELRAEEREFAIEQLNEAKAIASGERDEDMRRFLEEREMAKVERDFVIDEYNQLQMQAQLEREQDLAIRNQALAQIGQMQNAVQGASQQLGYVPEIPQLTEDDIAREIRRRESEYISDVDRAADRVASVNEADLIRQGLDESTTGTARRGEIAARLSEEYQDARQRAYDDALNYISGKSSAMSSNVGDIIKRRSAILGETADVASVGLDALQRLPGVASAQGAYSMATRAPSAIYSRNVSSANDYRAPVSIGSAIYDGINVGPALAQYRTPTSAASTSGMKLGSQIFNPYGVGIDNPATYLTNAGQIGNQLLSSATSSANAGYKRAYDAASGFGSDMRSFLDDNSKPIDNFFSGLFKKRHPDGMGP